MAKLIPHSAPSNIDLLPERIVAEALCANLPEDALVFHSYPWLRKDRDLERPGSRETLREGEADFVIVHPRFGFMVVEVKGGRMFYDPAAQRWDRQGATHAVKDPFDQAAKNLRTLEAMVKERSFPSHTMLPFARTRCVIFPDCDYKGTLPKGSEHSMIFGASDLATLGDKIEKLFRLQPFVPNERLSNHVIQGITQALTSTFSLVPALWRQVETQEATLVRMTDAQAQLLCFIDSHPRAAIKGVAGSGKTMLAMLRAKRFADENKRVLFLCFTKMLAEWVEASLPETYRDRLVVKHYHKLCAEWIKKTGLQWPAPTAEDWKLKIPRLLEQAIDLLPEEQRFDAIVVDEAQDFVPAWWDTVELLNRAPMEGPLYVFYDPAQRIYHENAVGMPDLGHHFDLPHNCRNTVAIANACGVAIKQPMPTPEGAMPGQKPNILHAPNHQAQKQEIEAQLKSWLGSNQLKRSQVAVLMAYPVENGPCSGLSQIAGHPITEDLNVWRSGQAVML
ncbi:MAG: NERD domain-containing protein, partial [Verrucomicrobiaceae bacterium]